MIERIQAKDITKQYTSRFLLQCSLEMEKGPLYAIVGPNGSGKSTLLRILSLIEPPDSGEVVYHDNGESQSRRLSAISLLRKAVLVPTRASLFSETVFENAAYGLKLRRVRKDGLGERVMRALHKVRLEDKRDAMARELSSGEAQRLALARALAIDPEVLLIDEPTASLDVENTDIVEGIIHDCKNHDKMIVMVTHNLYQAKALSDIVIFMFGGKVVEVADNQSFFNAPRSELAHKFISGKVY